MKDFEDSFTDCVLDGQLSTSWVPYVFGMEVLEIGGNIAYCMSELVCHMKDCGPTIAQEFCSCLDTVATFTYKICECGI